MSEGRQCIQRYVESYFRNVFASSRPQTADIARGTAHLGPIVDSSMAEELMSTYTEIEVTKALFQMASLKSRVLTFRSISLCNVVYKIASKAIANRLKNHLDRIISPTQSAFVSGRLITDNILLAFEINHYLNTKASGRQGYMALKLDISKAYDKVVRSSGQSFLRKGSVKGILSLLICFFFARSRSVLFCRNLRASDQEINFTKSSVALSKNTREGERQQVSGKLGIRRENTMELYLDLLSKLARSKRELFAVIRDRVWSRITGWNEKLLSHAGNEVLIKSVIQAIPTLLCGGLSGVYGISYQSRDEENFRSSTNKDKPLSQVLRALYYPSGDIFSVRLGFRPSFTWRSISSALPLFRAGCRWRVGSGSSICLLEDTWLPRPVSFKPITPAPAIGGTRLVAELIDPESRDWDLAKIENLFWPIDKDIILTCALEEETSCSNHGVERDWWKLIWQAKLSGKVCPHCGSKTEDTLHARLLCPFARQVWGLSNLGAEVLYRNHYASAPWLTSVADALNVSNLCFFCCICCSIWWSRNSRMHTGICLPPDLVVCFAVRYLDAFLTQNSEESAKRVQVASSRWSGPLAGVVKLNFDGAILANGIAMGIGVVTRD
ncbi:UNVERIFIED_CONTAM: hypothetical protein Sradi_6265500 [Sesamum radiatum]|uniref:Reverse transcriptase domain-containing protein n=1 Tax=Sesamum radiatum TaxID=300843 RepID=A0AAW2KAU2_SESRA